MAKPFSVNEIVSQSVTVRTADSSLSMVMDQSAANTEFDGAVRIAQLVMSGSTDTNVSPANASYATLTQADATNLPDVARLDVFPNVAGTVIHSLSMGISPLLLDGRILYIQNTGNSPGQTLTLPNDSATGTIGNRFFCSEDVVIPAGAGAILTYSAAGDGFWYVRMIPVSSTPTVAPLFDTVISAGPFGFGTAGVNENISLPLGQTTLIRYTVDSGSRQAGGLVNSNGGNVEGQIVCWFNNNVGVSDILIFVGNSAGSTVNANRFFNAGNGNADGETQGCVWYIYQGVPGVNGRWRELTNTSAT